MTLACPARAAVATAQKSPGSVRGFFVHDVRRSVVSMTPKELEQWEQDCRAAELALEAAQNMPGGPERIAALRRAGQLRVTTTLIAAEAPTVTAVAPLCSVSEIVTAVARPSSRRSG